MRTLTLEAEPIATGVTFSDEAFRVTLDDGRELTVPMAWFPRLMQATPSQRANWSLIGQGEGLRWDDLDEDISVAGLLAGRGDRTRPRPSKAHAA